VNRVLDPQRIITTGSNFGCGNGYLGYRGTFPEWTAREYVGCVVSDTYDMADGRWKELCTVPNGLWLRWSLDGEALAMVLCHCSTTQPPTARTPSDRCCTRSPSPSG
jgi:trehalose/maltose hydrolase-like predicted phosphorylase